MNSYTKEQSHLHEKYNLASKLPSILEQIELQVKEIITFNPENMLSVGIGYGDEIKLLIKKLETTTSLVKLKSIQWIDIHAEAGKNLKGFSSFVKIEKVEEINSLLNIANEDEWDCIQCSFVLHDIKYEDKKEAFSVLYKALKPNGKIIISEMFLDNELKSDQIEDLKRKKEVDDLYDSFCDELQTIDDIDNNEKEVFSNELLKIKEDARNGKRDFFMNRKNTEKLLQKSGFTDVAFIENKVYIENNKKKCYLGIITARKCG